MGLELVELVIRIEEKFEVSIPDEAAAVMTTPRHVIDNLMQQPTVSQQWSRGYVAITVWLMIEDELGIDRNQFNEYSRFIEDMGAG